MITVILSLVLQKKTHTMKSNKSHNHIIQSCEITECSLSCFDNKRYILEDGITTLAYRHYKTKSKAKGDKADRVTKEKHNGYVTPKRKKVYASMIFNLYK